ncbi:MAG TPA: hypothetical protein ENJ06_00155 [Phycisphaeraceae bacterium]|nr:hypothetical protein [Phycisphaeraceae bacterium]
MLTFEELSQLPRKKRRAGIAEYLAHTLHDTTDLSKAREAVYRINDLGSRWRYDVFELAKSDSTPDEVRNFLEGYVRSVTGRSFDITTRGDGLQRQEVAPLLRSLESCRVPRQKCYLTINFLVPHIAVTSLAAVAAWAEKNAHSVEFAFPRKRAQRVQGFLERTGILQTLGSHDAPDFHFDEKGQFAFLRLRPDAEDPLKEAGELLESCREILKDSPEIYQALREVVLTLVENVVAHARITSPAWLFISHHPKPAGVDIAICDLGRGMSCGEDENPENDPPKNREKHDAKALSACLKAGSPDENSLQHIKEICRKYYGKMLIISKGASYQLASRHTAKGEIKLEESCRPERYHLNGTLIGVHLSEEKPDQEGEKPAAGSAKNKKTADKPRKNKPTEKEKDKTPQDKTVADTDMKPQQDKPAETETSDVSPPAEEKSDPPAPAEEPAEG